MFGGDDSSNSGEVAALLPETKQQHLSSSTSTSTTTTTSTTTYRFHPDEEWLSHLQTQGFCVIANALSPTDVNIATELLWQDMELTWPGAKENFANMKLPAHGLAPELCQSAGAWHVRGNTNIKQAYEKIWDGDKELITSMESSALLR